MTTLSFPFHFVRGSQSRLCRLPIAILCLLFGIFGLHRFYVQKFGTGFLQLLTLGGFGLWVVADLILIFSGNFTDDMGFRIRRWH